jgi:hypothetical protein
VLVFINGSDVSLVLIGWSIGDINEDILRSNFKMQARSQREKLLDAMGIFFERWVF